MNDNGNFNFFIARDKAKLARQHAAKKKEKEDAHLKYQPYRETTPLNDIVQLIRSQAKVVLTMRCILN